MGYEIDQAVQHIEAWKAHLLRPINQDTAKQDVLKKLDNAALLVSDWAMKYVPCKYRESQRDWFGKRGISWHLSVAIKKSIDKGIEMLTFAHIFESCSQDSPTVLAIFNDVLLQLKSILPSLELVYMKQDNAGCYHSAPTMLGIHQIAKKNGVALARIDFSDPQGGKGACDRKAATDSLHEEGDLGVIGNECSSDSEDDLNDESLQVELQSWTKVVVTPTPLPPNSVLPCEILIQH